MTTRPCLYIGNRNYSSWSLRAWLALRFMEFDFDVERLSLDTPDFHARIPALSKAGRVPVLHHGQRVIWDSLAICEYVAERSRQGGWPADDGLRAHARAAVAEMHAGFGALRQALPMNIRARRKVALNAATSKDIDRLFELFTEALDLHPGNSGWLYAERSIADAYFAPVLLRFATYGIPVPDRCQPWVQTLLADADLQSWCAQAREETEVVAADEAGEPI